MEFALELLFTLIILGALYFLLKKVFSFLKKLHLQRMLKKWSELSKDKLILHIVWRCKPLPQLSPYGLKLETFLRMAKIPYEIDNENPFGPTGKVPWISYNGVNMGDSQLIIEFLSKNLDFSLNKNIPKEHLATAHACRIMLEDHFFWSIVQFRVIDNIKLLPNLMKLPSIFKLVLPIRRRQMQRKLAHQLIGDHPPPLIYRIAEEDLHTASVLLGSKKYFGGDEPCEDDCSMFAFIVQTVWGMPDSSFKKLSHGELINLKEYCERMKERFWPDWEDCLDKS